VPVRAEGYRVDGVGVAGEGAQRRGVVGVADTQSRGVVGASGGQGAPVGAEDHREDAGGAGEGAQWMGLAGILGIP
jgi:hypothetical protein